MTDARPLIYAEFLSNIQQVSVIAALSTPCDTSTRAELLNGGLQIAVFHRGEKTTLDLPKQVSPGAQLQRPTSGSKEISWRLPLARASSDRSADSLLDNDVPWSARELGEDSKFTCRACDATIVERGRIKEWKDLPSENWAEMMEFWHCHKPDVPEHEQGGLQNGTSGHEKNPNDEDPNANRGYGANTKFVARASTAFVDPTTFLLTGSDCSNIEGQEVRDTLPLIYSCNSPRSILQSSMGIKKVAKHCFCFSVVWSPIQVPYNDNLFTISLSSSGQPSWRNLFFGGWFTCLECGK